jgi:hypothetical protein
MLNVSQVTTESLISVFLVCTLDLDRHLGLQKVMPMPSRHSPTDQTTQDSSM